MLLCWSCGHMRMCPAEDLGKGWFKCADCEATWIKPLSLGKYPLSAKKDYATGGKSGSLTSKGQQVEDKK